MRKCTSETGQHQRIDEEKAGLVLIWSLNQVLLPSHGTHSPLGNDWNLSICSPWKAEAEKRTKKWPVDTASLRGLFHVNHNLKPNVLFTLLISVYHEQGESDDMIWYLPIPFSTPAPKKQKWKEHLCETATLLEFCLIFMHHVSLFSYTIRYGTCLHTSCSLLRHSVSLLSSLPLQSTFYLLKPTQQQRDYGSERERKRAKEDISRSIKSSLHALYVSPDVAVLMFFIIRGLSWNYHPAPSLYVVTWSERSAHCDDDEIAQNTTNVKTYRHHKIVPWLSEPNLPFLALHCSTWGILEREKGKKRKDRKNDSACYSHLFIPQRVMGFPFKE